MFLTGTKHLTRLVNAQKVTHEIDLEYGIFGSIFRSGMTGRVSRVKYKKKQKMLQCISGF